MLKSAPQTDSCRGNWGYWSIQQRRAGQGTGYYNPFKADVYALGATLLELASLMLADADENRDQKRARALESIPYSQSFKQLLRCMLRESEESIPTMTEVCEMLRNYSRELQSLHGALVYVEDREIHVFNLNRRTWRSFLLSFPTTLDKCSQYVWTEGELFCSGGAGKQETYLLSIEQEWGVSRQADMLMPRQRHGLWWAAETHSVQIFGGTRHEGFSKSALRECEEVSLGDGYSLELPSMRDGRSSFNPCEFHMILYLCGGFIDSVEAFDPYSRAFVPIYFDLPEKFTACIAFTVNAELVVVSECYVSRYSVVEDTLVQYEAVKRQQEGRHKVGSCMAPVVDAASGLVYITDSGSCYSMRIDGAEQLKLASVQES